MWVSLRLVPISALSTGYTCTSNYGFEQNIFSYVQGTTVSPVKKLTTRSEPEAHRKRTRSVPRPHLERTSTAPRTYLDRTSSVPRPHLERTSTAPRAYLDRTTSRTWSYSWRRSGARPDLQYSSVSIYQDNG